MDEPKEKAMNPETLKALHGSIKKWQAIVDGTGEELGSINCPLCHLFLYDENQIRLQNGKACLNCPIYEKTEVKFCEGTPYYNYIDASEEDEEEDMIKYAKAELEFLKSLMPKP